jgi:hypothetical protein
MWSSSLETAVSEEENELAEWCCRSGSSSRSSSTKWAKPISNCFLERSQTKFGWHGLQKHSQEENVVLGREQFLERWHGIHPAIPSRSVPKRTREHAQALLIHAAGGVERVPSESEARDGCTANSPGCSNPPWRAAESVRKKDKEAHQATNSSST